MFDAEPPQRWKTVLVTLFLLALFGMMVYGLVDMARHIVRGK